MNHPDQDAELLEYNMRVIDTDYSTYSIVYRCDEDSGHPWVWGFTRSQDLTGEWYDFFKERTQYLLPSLLGQTTIVHQGDDCEYDSYEAPATVEPMSYGNIILPYL